MKMLKHLTITNFKSLMDTKIKLEKNTFLIGLNGSGKTTILQSIDFLSAIAKGMVSQWLKTRGWERTELTFSGKNKKLIEYQIEFQLSEDRHYKWQFSFNRDLLRNTFERIEKIIDGQSFSLLEVKEGNYLLRVHEHVTKRDKITFNYEGSILSVLKKEIIGNELIDIHNFFAEIKSAELLSPILMKTKRARQSDGEIGLGGEKLSAFIYELPEEKKEKLLKELKRFFPYVEKIQARSIKAGWKKLQLNENFKNNQINIDIKHMSDGFLRIMAILSQLLSSESVLLFDEIEDGVNQELFNLLVELLLTSPHQTVVATHSPLLLNYLDDDTAKRSIVFVYRDSNGITWTANFFDILKKIQKYDKEMFELFGPGEWMQGVDLIEISNQLANMRD